MVLEELSVKFKAEISDYREKMGQVKQITQQVENVSNATSQEMTASMQKTADQMKDTADKVRLLKKQFQDKREEINNLTKKLSELQEKYKDVQKVTSEFGSVDGIRKQREELIKSIQDMETEIPKLKGKLEIAPDGLSSTNQLKSQLSDYKSQLNNARNEVDALDNATARLGKNTPETLNNEMEKLSAKLQKAENAEEQLKSKIDSANRSISTQGAKLQEMGNKSQSASSNTNDLKSKINQLGNTKSSTDTAKKNIRSIGNSADDVTKKLSKTVSSIRRLGIVSLGMRVVKSVFGELRSVVSSYLSQNEALNSRVEALKNAFGQALAPMISLVVGLFEKLMPVVLKVTQCISDLISSLGISKKLGMTAGALDGIANSTNKVAEAQSTLYGFDKITKVGDEKSENGSSTVPIFDSDTSGLDKSLDSIKKKLDSLGFDKLKESYKTFWKDFSKQVEETDLLTPLKSAFENALGLLISTEVLRAKIVLPLVIAFDIPKTVEVALELVNSLLKNLRKAVDAITPGVEAFVNRALKPIAEWCGEKVREALQFVSEQFEKIGSWFENHEDTFTRLGDALGKLGNTVWNFVKPFLDFGFQKVKKNFSDFVDGVLKNGDILLEGLTGFVDVINAVFAGDWEEVKRIGADLINGLVEGITNKINDTKEKIKTKFNEITDKVKEIFGVKSPSTVFAEIGGNLVDGLKNGIVDTFHKVINAVSEKISILKSNVVKGFEGMKTSVTTVFDSVKDKISGVWENILSGTKTFINKFLGFIESMLNKPVSKINEFIEMANKIGSAKIKGVEIGINIPKLSTVNIPRLAEGAIVDRPTLAMFGEAGKEAVIPLKKQASWIGELAKNISETISTKESQSPIALTVPIYFGGRKLTTAVFEDAGKTSVSGIVNPVKA